MQIKEQWLVALDGELRHLIETCRDGFFILYNGRYQAILTMEARSLITQTEQDAG